MRIFKAEPHPLLLGRMLGPQVPKDFKNDGCSRVPDLYLKWPCLIHDYQYWQLRRAWRVIEVLSERPGYGMWTQFTLKGTHPDSVTSLKAIGLIVGVQHRLIRVKELIMLHHEYRQLADKYLRANIKTLTRLKVVDGQVRKRPLWSRRLWGRGLNWAFYIGVRIGAGGAAKQAEKADAANE